MEPALAKSILNEAISGEFLDSLPETEEEILKLAEHFAEHAEKEYNEGWGKSNETITAIVNLLETPQEETDKSSPDQSARQNKEESGSVSSAFFRDLPLPQNNGDAPIEMPFNVSELTDLEVRKYHGIFNHYYGRARYALAEESASLTASEHLRDSAFRASIHKVSQDNILNETKKSAGILEAEAKTDEEYKRYDLAVKKHEQNVIKLKALADIYSKNVEVLSREGTIRQNEYERSR
jgi:hypothetical protein